MADISIYQNTMGEDCVMWTDEQGNHSMLKEAYLATLAANSATPQAQICQPSPLKV